MATETPPALSERQQDDLAIAQITKHAGWEAIQRTLDQLEKTHLENLVNEENPKERGIVLAVREIKGELDRSAQRGLKLAGQPEGGQ